MSAAMTVTMLRSLLLITAVSSTAFIVAPIHPYTSSDGIRCAAKSKKVDENEERFASMESKIGALEKEIASIQSIIDELKGKPRVWANVNITFPGEFSESQIDMKIGQ
jgi:peptidoglycan hydrolase CwlO-like protein